MFPKLGPLELTIILVIVVMLFGVGKLPELFGSIGRGVREFRKNADGIDDATTPGSTTAATNTSDDKPASPAGPTAPVA